MCISRLPDISSPLPISIFAYRWTEANRAFQLMLKCVLKRQLRVDMTEAYTVTFRVEKMVREKKISPSQNTYLGPHNTAFQQVILDSQKIDFYIQCKITLWHSVLQDVVMATRVDGFYIELDKSREARPINGWHPR